MTFAEVIKRAEKLAIDNSPTILTAVAVVGSLTTAYLTGKASFKASDLIEADRFRRSLHEKERPAETKDKVKLVWKEYIPAVTTGSLTVACIVGANRIGTRRAAAMAAAYSISEKAFTEYREKVVERIGKTKERAYRDEIAQERMDREPVSQKQVIVTGNGDVLCFDSYSGRYFNSKMESLKQAQNDTNYQVLNTGYASLSDFYERVGLPATDASEEVGWTTDKMLELEFSTIMSDDGRPCISFSFYVAPVRNYFRHV
jgi:hypothetical protein